jgi:hypothetical protein
MNHVVSHDSSLRQAAEPNVLWVISHAEVQRYQREGLLPLQKYA